MISSLSVLLCVMLIQDAYGTFFPPVNEPPPIPSESARSLSNLPQTFNSPVDLSRDLPQPNEEGLFPSDAKQDEERWYFQENPSRELRDSESSIETFGRYFQSGEPAIGPVATPIPDYLAQSSSISKSNPTDNINVGDGSNIFILARDSDGQYSPERWVEVQIPSDRVIKVVNQNPELPVATDSIKSIVAPSSFDIPSKRQFPPNPAVNILRQPSAVEFQKVFTNFPRVVENVPSVKQVVDVPPQQPLNVKTYVQQQQIINDVPSFPLPPQISSKKSFAVPPPPPPPLKGVNTPPKIISSVPVNVIPDSNVIVSSKNIIPDSNIVPGKSAVQQVRHVWVPTSSKTGKFITIPITGSINSDKSTVNKGFSLDSLPVTVSDTWVLKQNGPVPIFEQVKSALPPDSSPIVQSGKVIFQNPTIVQVDEAPTVGKVNSPKIPPVVEKNDVSNAPINIWPVRKELINPTIYGSYSPVITRNIPPAAVKSDAVIIENPDLTAPQKTIFTDQKSQIPLPIPSQTVQVVNGKPCPLPLPAPQKSLYPPLNARIISVPRVISPQRRTPFARIIRVNRYPTGSYYLLNRNIRPSYLLYPSQAAIQQPNTGLISVVQSKQLLGQFQTKIPVPAVQTKQISIPVQTKQIVSPLPAKEVASPFVSRQVIFPVTRPKSTRIVYPTVQAIRYAYPWNSYLRSSPVLDKGAYVPEFSPFKVGSARSKSESSSSESSSENSSSESSSESSEEEKKEEKSKKEKSKKEEKPKSVEKSSSKESETEPESKSKSKEIESEEKSTEKEESKESLETSESQAP